MMQNDWNEYEVNTKSPKYVDGKLNSDYLDELSNDKRLQEEIKKHPYYDILFGKGKR